MNPGFSGKMCLAGIGVEDYWSSLSIKLSIFSYPSVLTYVLGAQKNRLIEMVLLSTHNISFD